MHRKFAGTDPYRSKEKRRENSANPIQKRSCSFATEVSGNLPPASAEADSVPKEGLDPLLSVPSI